MVCFVLVSIFALLLAYQSTAYQVNRLTVEQIEKKEIPKYRAYAEKIHNRSIDDIFAFRIFSFLCIEALENLTSWTPVEIHVRAVMVPRFLCFLSLFYLFRVWNNNGMYMSVTESALGVLYTYYATNVSFHNEDLNHYEQLYFLFFIIFLSAVICKKDKYLFPLIILASFNKETSVLMPLIYISENIRAANNIRSFLRINRSVFVMFSALVSCSLLMVLSIRLFYSANGGGYRLWSLSPTDISGCTYSLLIAGILLFTGIAFVSSAFCRYCPSCSGKNSP